MQAFGLDEMQQRLPYEERVALRLFKERANETLRDVLPGQALEQRLDISELETG